MMETHTTPGLEQVDTECGVLYIALGAPYVEEAERSAASVKQSNPNLAICLITDQKVAVGTRFDIVLEADSPSDTDDSDDGDNAVQSEVFLARDRTAYYRKIQPLRRSPFERTIFLDSDTWVSGSLGGVFKLFDKFDLLTTPCFITVDYAFEANEAPFSKIPEAFGYFNTGFFGFRQSEGTDAFIDRWLHNFAEHGAKFSVNDQPAFRLSLFETDTPFHVLPTAYNTVSWAPFVIPGGGQVVVLHGRNPWLQRWAHKLKSGRPAIVGSLSLKHLLIYHSARLCYLGQRLLRKFGFRVG